MQFHILKASEIDDALASEWQSLLELRRLDNLPFLRPEYIRLMGPYRSRLQVMVAEDSHGLCGILPFEKHGNTGQPPGVLMTDYQCLLQRPDTTISLRNLLRACRLKRLKFDHLLVEDSPFAAWHHRVSDSYWIDLTEGADAWESALRQSNGGTLRNASRKLRALERDFGPVTCEWHSDEMDDFLKLNAWKSAQRERTHTFDVLKLDWVHGMIQDLLMGDEPELQPVLSTLRVQDRLVAVSLGMRTGNCSYDWFPAFDIEFGRYSPGLLLTVWRIREAARRGIIRFDFGKGAHQQKLSLSNATTPVANAVIDPRPLHSTMHRIWRQCVDVLKSPPFERYVAIPKRIVRSRAFKKRMS